MMQLLLMFMVIYDNLCYRNCVTMWVSYCWKNPMFSLYQHRSLSVETFMDRYDSQVTSFDVYMDR